MLNGFSFQGDAFFKIDPRTKLLIFILCSFAALRESRTVYQSILFFFMFVLLINGRQFAYAMKMLVLYGVLCMIDLLVLYVALPEGVKLLLVGIRVFRMFLPVLMAFALMIKTTKVSEFLAAFEKMHFPEEITIPFSVMFRFFPTIGEEWDNIRNAMRFRGFDWNLKNLLTRPGLLYECTIVPLLSNTVVIADELSAASLCRGLGAKTGRSSMCEVRMGILDVSLIGISLYLTIVSFSAY